MWWLGHRIPFFLKNHQAAELAVYFAYSAPLGILINIWMNNQILGLSAFTYTLLSALLMRATDASKLQHKY